MISLTLGITPEDVIPDVPELLELHHKIVSLSHFQKELFRRRKPFFVTIYRTIFEIKKIVKYVLRRQRSALSRFLPQLRRNRPMLKRQDHSAEVKHKKFYHRRKPLQD